MEASLWRLRWHLSCRPFRIVNGDEEPSATELTRKTHVRATKPSISTPSVCVIEKRSQGSFDMNLNLKKLKEAVSAWQNISVHPHRFGGMEFQFGDAEVGHVHTDGSLIYPSRVQSAMHCWQMV